MTTRRRPTFTSQSMPQRLRSKDHAGKDLRLETAVERGEVGNVGVAQWLGHHVHHLVLACAALVVLERLGQVLLHLTGKMRRLRQFRLAVQPVASLALRRLGSARLCVGGQCGCTGAEAKPCDDGDPHAYHFAPEYEMR